MDVLKYVMGWNARRNLVPKSADHKVELNPNQTGLWEDCQVPGYAQFLTTHSQGLNLPPQVFPRSVVERYGFGNLPKTVLHHQSTWKSDIVDPTENLPSPALCTARDQKLIGILIGAVLNCRPQPVRTFPALRWSKLAIKPSRRWQGCWAAQWPEFWCCIIKKRVKTSFWCCVSSKNIFTRCFCRNRYFLK